MLSLSRNINYYFKKERDILQIVRFISKNILTSDILYDKRLNSLITEREILDGKKGLDTKILHVGLCGAPNSGKSTLLNTFVGKKLSAVSHKVNTTRLEILGVKNIGSTQLVFHDTPGILQKSGSSQEEKELTGVAKKSLESVDAFITIIDASIPLTYLSREVIHVTTSLAQQYNAHLLFAMNKVDLVKQKQILEERKQLIINEIPELLRPSLGFDEKNQPIFMISALKGKGLISLEEKLVQLAHPGYWYFSDGISTNRSQEEQANEVIREKAFHYLNQEIPYELIFEHRGWKKDEDILVLEEGLIAQSPSQQRIVSKAKYRIEKDASQDLSILFNRKIRVHITVSVEKKTK